MTSNDTQSISLEAKKGPKSEDLDSIANFMDNILCNMKEHLEKSNIKGKPTNVTPPPSAKTNVVPNKGKSENKDNTIVTLFPPNSATQSSDDKSILESNVQCLNSIDKEDLISVQKCSKTVNKSEIPNKKSAPNSLKSNNLQENMKITPKNNNKQSSLVKNLVKAKLENKCQKKSTSKSFSTMSKQTELLINTNHPQIITTDTVYFKRPNSEYKNDRRDRSHSHSSSSKQTTSGNRQNSSSQNRNPKSRSRSKTRPANILKNSLQIQTPALNNSVNIAQNKYVAKNMPSIAKPKEQFNMRKFNENNRPVSTHSGRTLSLYNKIPNNIQELNDKKKNITNNLLRPALLNPKTIVQNNNTNQNRNKSISLNSKPVNVQQNSQKDANKKHKVHTKPMQQQIQKNSNIQPISSQNTKQIEIVNRMQVKNKNNVVVKQIKVHSPPTQNTTNIQNTNNVSQASKEKEIAQAENKTEIIRDTEKIDSGEKNVPKIPQNINEKEDKNDRKQEQSVTQVKNNEEIVTVEIIKPYNAQSQDCQSLKISEVKSNDSKEKDDKNVTKPANQQSQTVSSILKQNNKNMIIKNNNTLKCITQPNLINNQIQNKINSFVSVRTPCKTNSVLNSISSKKLLLLTPMEIVQDFVNLVNKAKRDRKTYTICGNFFSIRRAFAERGWIEKIRVNVTEDKDSWKKIESLSNFELVEGIRDKENSEKYRRAFISKLLAGHQVDFYWDYMANPFNVNSDKVKRTLINRFPYGTTRSYTSKAGLCESLKEAYWYYIDGAANILFPRTYNLATEEEVKVFVDDFRLTAVVSLLQWICNNSNNPGKIISCEGKIPTSVFNFATTHCQNFIKQKEHRDIDEIIVMARDYEWDVFLEKFYKIIHQQQHFQDTERITAHFMIDQSRYLINKLRKHLPDINMDGIMNLWILKPHNGSRGCGILVCRTLKYMLDAIQSRKEQKFVVQKYIERPLLIHNTKFDIRQWFLVTSMPNLNVWMYKECYLRFSTQIFDLSKLHESIHLTNNSVQCKYKNNNQRSNELPDQNMWHSDTFQKYLTDIGQPYAWKNVVYKGMKESLVGLFMLCQEKLATRINSFELCGADFMINEEFKPYLIEINSRPALYPSTRITARMCPKVLEDVVRVTVDHARNPKASTGNFELIYKDTMNHSVPRNVNSLCVDGMSYFSKYATKKSSVETIEKVKENDITNMKTEDAIQKLLNIDPNKVRKDVRNTLEKILAVVHSEKGKLVDKQTSTERNQQFKAMLSDFVDIISNVKNKVEVDTQVK